MARQDVLITAPDLAAALRSADPPTLLDARWNLTGPPAREAYQAGHIEGAVFIELEAVLASAPGPGGRHPLPDPGSFERAMRAAGVSMLRPVVIYDAGGTGMAAARAWWLLRDAGHLDVRVLDGGLGAWQAAGLRTSTDVPQPDPGDFVAHPGTMARVGAGEVGSIPEGGTLLDARAGERFRGETEPIDPVAGHIPGARNLPVSELVDSSGALRPDDDLEERFAARGALGGGPVVAYCGSGVSAANLVLAGAAVGIPVALYPGSWSEWVSDPSRPVATGP